MLNKPDRRIEALTKIGGLTSREWCALILVGSLTLLGIEGVVEELRFLFFSDSGQHKIASVEKLPERFKADGTLLPRRVILNFEIDSSSESTTFQMGLGEDDERVSDLEQLHDLEYISGSPKMIRFSGQHNWVSCGFVLITLSFGTWAWRVVLPEAREHASSRR